MRIKDCPFCGGGVYLEKTPLWNIHSGITHGYLNKYEFNISCENCGCTLKYDNNNTIYIKEEEAKRNVVSHWNNRINEVNK